MLRPYVEDGQRLCPVEPEQILETASPVVAVTTI
jgi:hypothetical protein